MNHRRRPLRVFVASPGDVGEERVIAREILSQLPYDPLIDWKVAFEVVAWDQPRAGPPMLATMTPQAAISAGLPKPSTCDIVVVILWSRMGTPLPTEYRKPDGTPYRSGTEWEYLDAFAEAQRSGSPKLLVYRRTEPCPLDPQAPDYEERRSQLQQLQAFFAEFRNPDGSIRGGVNEYADPADFRRQFEGHLRTIVARELAVSGDGSRLEERPGASEQSEEPESSTTTAVFVGPTLRGPVRPELIIGWDDFVRTYGDGLPGEISFLAHAVRGFFDNGGGRAYVARIVGAGATLAAVQLGSTDGGDTLGFEATSLGTWGNRLGVRVRTGTRTGLRITVVDRSTAESQDVAAAKELEDWDNLGIDPTKPNFIAQVIDESSLASPWVRCVQVPTKFEPEAGDVTVWLTGGSDGAPPTADDYVGDRSAGSPESGLLSTEGFEDAVLLCVPDHVHESLSADDRRTLTQEMVTHCERLLHRSGHRFVLLSVDQGHADPKSIRPIVDSQAAALYAPWVWVQEFGRNSSTLVPVVGHVAGVFARSDLEQGVHHAPVRERLSGLSSDADGRSVEFAFGPAEVDTLSRLGVNAIGNDERGQGPCLLTAITTSTDEQSRSIATQRLLAFIGSSIERGTRWAKSELKGKALRDRLNRDITAFLESVWSSGALLGKTRKDLARPCGRSCCQGPCSP